VPSRNRFRRGGCPPPPPLNGVVTKGTDGAISPDPGAEEHRWNAPAGRGGRTGDGTHSMHRRGDGYCTAGATGTGDPPGAEGPKGGATKGGNRSGKRSLYQRIRSTSGVPVTRADEGTADQKRERDNSVVTQKKNLLRRMLGYSEVC